MANSQLKDMLTHAGQRMALDLRQRLVPHHGEQGAAREEIVRAFLRSYLPKRFEVSSGFVFDAGGRISGQTDIINSGYICSSQVRGTGRNSLLPV